MNGCTLRVQVDRHFAGTISPDAERAMRAHLPTCNSCEDRYRRHLLLARLDPTALPADERIARGLGLQTGRQVVAMSLGVVTALAAAAVLLLRVHLAVDGFSARGNVGTLSSRESRVFVYDVRRGSAPAPIGDGLRAGDELAFAYENGAAKRRLAIFGVDEHGHVYWFHPAWTRETDDPVAIPIEIDDQRHELPEAVLQPFDGARLQIRSVFVDDPISVRQVETLVRRDPMGALPIPGAVETSLTLAVTP